MEAREAVMEIALGHFDGELESVWEAVYSRLRATDGPEMHWQVNLDGISVTEDDLTLQECIDWEARSGTPWSILKPATSAKLAQDLLVVVLMSRKDMSEEDAVSHLASLTQKTVVDAITTYEVPASPLAQT